MARGFNDTANYYFHLTKDTRSINCIYSGEATWYSSFYFSLDDELLGGTDHALHSFLFSNIQYRGKHLS